MPSSNSFKRAVYSFGSNGSNSESMNRRAKSNWISNESQLKVSTRWSNFGKLGEIPDIINACLINRLSDTSKRSYSSKLWNPKVAALRKVPELQMRSKVWINFRFQTLESKVFITILSEFHTKSQSHAWQWSSSKEFLDENGRQIASKLMW